MRKHIKAFVFAAALALVALPAAQATTHNERALTPLENKVRHELVMLPYLGVFDNISYRVEGFRQVRRELGEHLVNFGREVALLDLEMLAQQVLKAASAYGGAGLGAVSQHQARLAIVACELFRHFGRQRCARNTLRTNEDRAV